jgi:flavin-binding protein dodecin
MRGGLTMSIYKVVELIGTSDKSWEDAAQNVVQQASKTLRQLRVAEIKQLDIAIDDSGALTYRAKVSLSLKYEGD